MVEGKISEEQARFATPESQKGSGREAVESLESGVKEAVRPPKTPAKEAAGFPQALPKIFEVAEVGRPKEAARPPERSSFVSSQQQEPPEVRSQIEARPKEAARPPSADPQEAAEQGGRRGPQEAAGTHREAKPQDPTLMIVFKLMEGMQAIQQKLVEDRNEEKGGSEFVRSNTPLPALAEWTLALGPIDLFDWLALIEPMMGDLTSTSSTWWETLMKEAMEWY